MSRFDGAGVFISGGAGDRLRHGGALVTCAHAGIAAPLPLLEMTDEHWPRQMAVNVDGVVFSIVEAARAMVATGRLGSIVCTPSINAWFVEETNAVYNVTKSAAWTFIRSAAIDLDRHGIRVNGQTIVIDGGLTLGTRGDPERSAEDRRSGKGST